MVVLICSQFRPGEKVAYDEVNGTLPTAARPEATVTKFCSATPTSKYLSGNFFLKSSIRVDSVKSAQSATTFGFSSPATTNPSPNPFRGGTNSTSVSNNFGFKLALSFNIVISRS